MKTLKRYLPLIGGFLLILAAFALFLPAVKLKIVNPLTSEVIYSDPVSGLDAVFGVKEQFLGQTITIYKFNIGSFIGYLLALVAGVFVLLKGVNKYFGYAGVVLGLAATVMIFLEVVFFKNANALDGTFVLAVGPILGGIVAALGTIASAAGVFVSE